MKKKIKQLLAQTISPFYCLHGARILYFHSIHPSSQYANTPEIFAGMMKSISNLAKICYTMTELTEKLNNQSISDNSVAITFDDGYHDNYEYAFPMLMDMGAKGTFYVIAGLIADKTMKPRLQTSDGLNMLTREQIVEMSNAGMEIGSHTWSHYALRNADKKTLQYELENSKKYLEDLTGRKVTSFSYPNGEVPMNIPENELFDLFKEIGYSNVATSKWGCVTNQSQSLQLDRQAVEVIDTPKDFRNKLKGKYDYLRLVQKIKGL
jgi:peptidoglycan/xylan/chitin deacetylase (PgdA/CDA1 family)